MALTGTHHRALDGKLRVAIPKPFRDQLCSEAEAELFLAPETEKSLALFSARAFEERARRIGSQSAGKELQRYLRLYYSQASSVDVDAQGRIRIPERLAEFAGLKEEVVMLGVNDHVEIWDRTRWDSFLGEHGSGFDQLALDAFAQTPCIEKS